MTLADVDINSMLLIPGENENYDITYMLLMTMHIYAVGLICDLWNRRHHKVKVPLEIFFDKSI